MPSTGTPSVEELAVGEGRVGVETLEGPPERMMPFGANARDLLERDVAGMDLAVDAALADAARDELGVLRAEVEDQDAIAVRIGGISAGSSLLLEPVVGCFLGDHHVVDVALLERRLGDAHEARLRAQLGEVRCADVAHAGAQPADELVHVAGQAPRYGTRPSMPSGTSFVGSRRRPGSSGRASRRPWRRASPCRGRACRCGPGRESSRRGSRRCRRRASRS